MGNAAKDLALAIRARRTTIERLRNELEILEQAQALLNSGGRLSPGAGKTHAVAVALGGAVQSRAKASRTSPRRDRFDPKGGVATAAAAIKAAGVALRIDAMFTQAKKIGYQGNERSLSRTVYKFAKRQRIFSKAGPYTFGLLEWERAKAGT